jgi:hypothetical protein
MNAHEPSTGVIEPNRGRVPLPEAVNYLANSRGALYSGQLANAHQARLACFDGRAAAVREGPAVRHELSVRRQGCLVGHQWADPVGDYGTPVIEVAGRAPAHLRRGPRAGALSRLPASDGRPRIARTRVSLRYLNVRRSALRQRGRATRRRRDS